jgi:hypothetical protein
VAVRIASINPTNAATLLPALPVTGCLRALLQSLDRSRAYASRRKIDHAQERAVVRGRGDQAQIGERVLHFGALEKAHAAIDAVRHARVEQRVLDHTRLRVGAVEHGDLRRRDAIGNQAIDDVDDECRLVDVGWRGKGAHRLAFGIGGP